MFLCGKDNYNWFNRKYVYLKWFNLKIYYYVYFFLILIILNRASHKYLVSAFKMDFLQSGHFYQRMLGLTFLTRNLQFAWKLLRSEYLLNLNL
jgi:hypothetical protein